MLHNADEKLNRPALEDLYRRLEKPLYNVLYRWVWDVDEAQELVQETFLRLWKMKDRVRMQTVEALTFRIGTNLAANRRRARKLWRLVTLEAVVLQPAQSQTVEKTLEQQQVSLAVYEAIDALPDRLRRVILLCEFSKMPYKDIARALGIPEGTVGSRRNAALKRLRQRLAHMTVHTDDGGTR